MKRKEEKMRLNVHAWRCKFSSIVHTRVLKKKIKIYPGNSESSATWSLLGLFFLFPFEREMSAVAAPVAASVAAPVAKKVHVVLWFPLE